jgi:hypothetical protein
MPFAGRPFFALTLLSGVILGSLGFPGNNRRLAGPTPALATSSAKKLEKKLGKKAKKAKQALKKAEKKARRAEKTVLVGALKVGAVVLAGAFEPSRGDEEADMSCPSQPGVEVKIESIRSGNNNAPKRPPASALPIHPTHRTDSPKP